jgi:hypothetical protein
MSITPSPFTNRGTIITPADFAGCEEKLAEDSGMPIDWPTADAGATT